MSITRNQAAGAYRRWSPPSFDEPEPEETETAEAAERTEAAPDGTPDTDAALAPEGAESEPTAPAEPAITLPTAEEIEAIYEQAHDEGHAAGLETGRASGYAEGMNAAREQVQRLTEVVGAMDLAFKELSKDVAEELVGLATALAREMVGHSLRTHPAGVIETVRDALQRLPQGSARILLHPDDLTLVRDELDEEFEAGRHTLVADADIARGGCRLETPAAGIDATVHTRWLRVLRGIGRDGPGWDAAPAPDSKSEETPAASPATPTAEDETDDA